jgi:uncharacterized Zn finger protein (UPF0148 family)
MQTANIEELHGARIKEFAKNGGKVSGEEAEYLLNVMPILKDYCEEQTRVANEHGKRPLHGAREPRKSGRMAGYATVDKGATLGTLHLEYLKATTDIREPKRGEVTRALSAIEDKEDPDICPSCNAAYVLLPSDGYMFCPECGVSVESVFDPKCAMSYSEEVTRASLPSFCYKRSNHLTEALAQLQAKQTTVIPENVLDAVKAEFKKARETSVKDITIKKVREYLKKLGFTRYYEHSSFIAKLLGVEPPRLDEGLENTLKSMFMAIQAPFAKHCPADRSNFCSYNYILHKLCELLDRDDLKMHFPLLKSRQKTVAHDALWKKICAEMSWEFIPSV